MGVRLATDSRQLSHVLFQWLRRSTIVRTVDLSCTIISGDTLVLIKEAAKHNPLVSGIILRGASFNADDKGAELQLLRGLLACMVTEASASGSDGRLAAQHGCIRELDWNNHRYEFKISDAWAKVFAQGIRGTRVNDKQLVCTITHLNLGSNRISTEGAVLLANALATNGIVWFR